MGRVEPVAVQMTTDMRESDKVPYFLWNEETTVGRLREILSDTDNVARPIYLARVMREGRVRDVWAFVSPEDVAAMWSRVERHLGRRRAFWRYLLDVWTEAGAI